MLSLADWRAERSYLWSVFVGELVEAAVTVADHALCERLLDDLMPVADSCAVNGALVCFMGAHADRVGPVACRTRAIRRSPRVAPACAWDPCRAGRSSVGGRDLR